MTDSIPPLDLLQILLQRSDSLATYWHILIAGITVIVGALASGKSFENVRTTKMLLSGLFIVFAISNLVSILYLIDQRQVIIELLPQSEDYLKMASAFAPPNQTQIILFHLVIQVTMVGLIWLIPWFAPKNSQQITPADTSSADNG